MFRLLAPQGVGLLSSAAVNLVTSPACDTEDESGNTSSEIGEFYDVKRQNIIKGQRQDKMTWSAAQQHCGTTLGSTLYSPVSLDDPNLLRIMGQRYSSIWVNMRQEKCGLWLNGTCIPENITRFIKDANVHEHKNRRIDNNTCVIWMEGQPSLVDCTSERGIMCDVKGKVQCKKDKRKTWEKAKASCERTGGHLLQKPDRLFKGVGMEKCNDSTTGYWTGIRFRLTFVEGTENGGLQVTSNHIRNCSSPSNELKKSCMKIKMNREDAISCEFVNCSVKEFYICGSAPGTRAPFTSMDRQGVQPLVYICVFLAICLLILGAIVIKFNLRKLEQMCHFIRDITSIILPANVSNASVIHSTHTSFNSNMDVPHTAPQQVSGSLEQEMPVYAICEEISPYEEKARPVGSQMQEVLYDAVCSDTDDDSGDKQRTASGQQEPCIYSNEHLAETQVGIIKQTEYENVEFEGKQKLEVKYAVIDKKRQSKHTC